MAAPSTRNIVPLLQFAAAADPVKTKELVILQAVTRASVWTIPIWGWLLC